MPCDHINGAIVCSRGSRQRRMRCFACHAAGGLQCDWKMGASKTCDRHLCPDHAKEVAKDKHLCPEHQETYKKWLADRARREPVLESDEARQADADFGHAMGLDW